MTSNISYRTNKFKELAMAHGFMGVGISKAERLDEEAKKLEEWLSNGYHGEMAYMANHFEKRVDPTVLVPGAKSVVSLMYNYFPGNGNAKDGRFSTEEDSKLNERIPDAGYQMPDSGSTPIDSQLTTVAELRRTERENKDERKAVEVSHEDERKQVEAHNSPNDSQLTTDNSQLTTDNSQLTTDDSRFTKEDSFKISRYAYGEDYHKVVRRKLKALVADLKQEIGDFYGRVFVDSAPVMERDWAKRSGMGWIGKNTLLIHPKMGSYFFLAEIILDVEFDYDQPIRDHCGTCTKCIDACPTEAISSEGYVLDGSKCISYLTIELKSQIPDSFKDKMEDWIFGCDICQEVCPWNRFSTPHHENAFTLSEDVRQMNKKDWTEMTEEIFTEHFEKSPLQRPGFGGIKRNISFVSAGK